jgi:hypothetical protein
MTSAWLEAVLAAACPRAAHFRHHSQRLGSDLTFETPTRSE